MKFKVGQIIELIDGSGMSANTGAKAKVLELNRWDKELVRITWLEDTTQNGGCYYAYRFKPAIGEQLVFPFMEK